MKHTVFTILDGMPSHKTKGSWWSEKWKPKGTLFYEFLGLEEASQVEYLPCGQSKETTHAEDAEVQHAAVCWLWKPNIAQTIQ